MKKSNGKIFGSLVLGALIGSAIGVLFAPKSGKETREELLAEIERLKKDLEKYANDFSDKAKQKTAEIEARLRKTEDELDDLEEELGV